MSDLRVSLDVSAVTERPAGAGRYILELLGALVENDEVTPTLLVRRGDADRFRAIAPAASVVELIPARRPLRLAYEQLRLGSRLGRLGVDVHHAPHYTMPRRSPVPVVVTIHDLTFFDRPEVHERTKVAFFTRAIRRAALEADALVCVSQRTATRLGELLEVRAPVFVAPHGIDHARFSPHEPTVGSDHAVLARLGLDPGRRRIVTVGTLEPRKGLLELLDAFDSLAGAERDVDLVLAGQRGWGLEPFDRRLAQSPWRSRIEVLGFVADDVVPALLRTAAVVAYPSVDEGFGLPALEGLACGAPVVTTERSVMAEICGAAPWLVSPEDAASLAAGLSSAMSASPDERGRRRALGLEVAASHTWAAAAESHVDAYRSAVELGRRSRG